MKHIIHLPPGRPDDGAGLNATLLLEPETRKAIAVIVPWNRVAGGVQWFEFPILLSEGMLLAQKSRG